MIKVFYTAFIVLLMSFSTAAQYDSIPLRNRQVLDYVTANGRKISPTYRTAVCTEMVVAVLEQFIPMTPLDKAKVNIINVKRSAIYNLIQQDSPITKGVYYALTSNDTGIPIDNLTDVLPGDFVQFWYCGNHGHCGIVESINIEKRTMKLHSSDPSTRGYGVQTYPISAHCFFVRLK